jgi:hypothetical protein
MVVAPFVSVVVDQRYLGTSMPFEEGATIPLIVGAAVYKKSVDALVRPKVVVGDVGF